MSPRSRSLPLVIGLLVAAAVFARLGIWQLDRLKQRRADNAVALAARNEPRVDVTDAGRAGRLAGRPVRAVGTYDRGHEIVIRGQALAGVPGVVVVTPLRLSEHGDTAVLVERGFVPVPDATSLPAETPALDEPGEHDVRGLGFTIRTSPDSGRPLTHDGRTTWRQLDLAALRRRLPYPILGLYVLQTPDAALPDFPRRREPPALDEGPHLSYAIQWFAFAVIAAVFGIVFLRRAPAR
jgi:surfeit locus 1 family protein